MFVLLALLFSSTAYADSFQLILQDPTGVNTPDDRCEHEVCTSLLKLINSSTSSIDFALYGMRNQNQILSALVAAKKRGVEVRGIVDMDVNNNNYYSSTGHLMANIDGIQTDYQVDTASKAARTPFTGKVQCPRPQGHQGPLQCNVYDFYEKGCFLIPQASKDPIEFQGDIMHDKFFIVDQKYLWTGSTNVSDSGTGGYNANLVAVIESPTVASWYTREFENMYKFGQFHKLKPKSPLMNHQIAPGQSVSAYFSPQDKPITNVLLPLVRRSKHTIEVAVFFLTHKELTQELINAKRRGVDVRVLLDASGATNEYSKHDVLRAYGIPVKVETFGGKLHAKTALFDSKTLILGSMNFTSAGERGNDENTMVFYSPSHGAQYKAWFNKMWAGIDDRWLHDQPAPESLPSGSACFDGVDNDYDHLPDAKDPSCSKDYPGFPPRSPGTLVARPQEGCSRNMYETQED